MKNLARNQNGTFKKGSSGNPGGRPKGVSLTALLLEELNKIPPKQKEPYKKIFIKKLLKKALVDEDGKILKLIWAYVDGAPRQGLDVDAEVKMLILPPEIINKNNLKNQ